MGSAPEPQTEFQSLLRRRRMVRSFTGDPVDAILLDQLLDDARRAPSAGNTQAASFLVLSGPKAVARYWNTTMSPERQKSFAWPGLLSAPVLVVLWVDPAAYVSRYGEADKVQSGLGESADAWPVPYWFVDGGAVLQNLLLGATDRGLGACLFGMFDHEPMVRDEFAVAGHKRGVGVVALGHPAPDRVSRSARRPRPSLDSIVQRLDS